MTSIRLGTIAAAAGVIALLSCATAAMAQDDPVPTRVQYYFQCPDAIKVRNGAAPTPWSTLPPNFSYQGGNGCGTLDTGVRAGIGDDTLYDAVFEGTHTGPVSALTVDLHDLILTRAQLTSGVTFVVRLDIDGETVLGSDGLVSRDDPVVSPNGLSQAIDFSVTNLQVSDGGTHTYRLAIDRAYIDHTAAWVWGASEIRSGIEFNPVVLASPRVRAPSAPPA